MEVHTLYWTKARSIGKWEHLLDNSFANWTTHLPIRRYASPIGRFRKSNGQKPALYGQNSTSIGKLMPLLENHFANWIKFRSIGNRKYLLDKKLHLNLPKSNQILSDQQPSQSHPSSTK